MTTSSSDQTNIQDDLDDDMIRQKFKQLLAQETVPDQLTQNVLQMLNEQTKIQSTQNQTTHNQDNFDTPAQNHFFGVRQKATIEQSSNDENAYITPSSSKFSAFSSRIWLSLAAGITAVAVLIVVFQSKSLNSEHPSQLAQENTSIKNDTPTYTNTVVEPVTPIDAPIVQPEEEKETILAQQQPPSTTTMKTPTIVKEKSIVEPAIIASQNEVQQPKSKSERSHEQLLSSPKHDIQTFQQHAPVYQAHEPIESDSTVDEFSDLYPASEQFEFEENPPTNDDSAP